MDFFNQEILVGLQFQERNYTTSQLFSEETFNFFPILGVLQNQYFWNKLEIKLSFHMNQILETRAVVWWSKML